MIAQQAEISPVTQSRHPSGFHFLTPVWGARYTQLYLDTVIPAQLADGNLPSCREAQGSRYIIYTTARDAATIRAARVYEALAEILPVEIVPIENDITLPHDTMSECYRRGIAAANGADAAIVFLTPDFVFADGSFASLKKISGQGRDVIFVPGIRTLKAPMSLELRKAYRRGNAIAIAIGPRALMRLALDNLHPMARASYWDESAENLIQANLFWSVGSEGIFARCFHLHPLLVYPQRKDAVFFGTLDDDYVSAACPDSSKDYVMTDSDELLGVELSDLNHVVKTRFRKRSLDDTIAWAELEAAPRHRLLFKRGIRMHAEIRDPALWAATEVRAAQTANAIDIGLARPAFSLLTPRRIMSLFGRISRHARDRRLAAENGFIRGPGPRGRTAPAQTGTAQSLILRFYAWYGRSCRSAMAVARRLDGPVQRPSLFSIDYARLRPLAQAVAGFLPSDCNDILVVSDRPDESVVPGILTENGKRLQAAQFLLGDDHVRLYDFATNDFVASASQDFVVVDKTPLPPASLRSASAEIVRIFKPRGRLLIVADRTRDQSIADEAAAIRMLSPDLTVLEHRLIGGLGSESAALMKRCVQRIVWMPYLLLFFLKLIFSPLVVLVNFVVILLNFVGGKTASPVATVTLAMKSAPEQTP